MFMRTGYVATDNGVIQTRQQSTIGGYHRCAVGVREKSTQKAGFSTASALISRPQAKNRRMNRAQNDKPMRPVDSRRKPTACGAQWL
jgi:hypothetical protein